MSVPSVIFPDTSIFDEMSYNFEAAGVRAFTEAIKDTKITLVMPDPTRRELKRHIRDRAKNASATLEGLGRRFSAIRGLKGWPLCGGSGTLLENRLNRLGLKDFYGFLKMFEVVDLSYDSIKISEIMDWYDGGLAPFSDKKRKEFPDALATMAIADYQRKSEEGIAVISRDLDFRAVCERYPGLFYYPSLAAYTEALKGSDKRVKSLQNALEENDEIITERVIDTFLESSFILAYEPSGEVTEVEFYDISSCSYHVVGLGEEACSISFDFEIRYMATVEYDAGDWDTYHWARGRVRDRAYVSGVIKLKTNKTFSKFLNVENLAMDELEYKIREHPRDDY